MDTYTMAVYSQLRGPIAIEASLTKHDLFDKLIMYLNKYAPDAVDEFVRQLDLQLHSYDFRNAIVVELTNKNNALLYKENSDGTFYLKFNETLPGICLEFLFRDRDGNEFTVFAKKD